MVLIYIFFLAFSGIFPYEYIDSFEKLEEKELPDMTSFFSSLTGEGITDGEYQHAQEVWKTFGCRTLGEYQDLYVVSDVVLLADIFQN